MMDTFDFQSFLDDLYFEGYADQLADQNPLQFNQELQSFLNQYGHESAQ